MKDKSGFADVTSFMETADQCHAQCNEAEEDAFFVNKWNDNQDNQEIKFKSHCHCALKSCDFKFSNEHQNQKCDEKLHLVEIAKENRSNASAEARDCVMQWKHLDQRK